MQSQIPHYNPIIEFIFLRLFSLDMHFAWFSIVFDSASVRSRAFFGNDLGMQFQLLFFSLLFLCFNLKCVLYRRHPDNTLCATSHQPHNLYLYFTVSSSFVLLDLRFGPFRRLVCVCCEWQIASFSFCLIFGFGRVYGCYMAWIVS